MASPATNEAATQVANAGRIGVTRIVNYLAHLHGNNAMTNSQVELAMTIVELCSQAVDRIDLAERTIVNTEVTNVD